MFGGHGDYDKHQKKDLSDLGGPAKFFNHVLKTGQDDMQGRTMQVGSVRMYSSFWHPKDLKEEIKIPDIAKKYIEMGILDGCGAFFKQLIGAYNIETFHEFDEFWYFRKADLMINRKVPGVPYVCVFIPEILLQVLAYVRVPSEEFMSCMCVSKYWNSVVNTTVFWKGVFKYLRKDYFEQEISYLIKEEQRYLDLWTSANAEDSRACESDPESHHPDGCGCDSTMDHFKERKELLREEIEFYCERERRTYKKDLECVAKGQRHPKIKSFYIVMSWKKYPVEYRQTEFSKKFLGRESSYNDRIVPFNLLRTLTGMIKNESIAKSMVTNTLLIEMVVKFLYGATGWVEQMAAAEFFSVLAEHSEKDDAVFGLCMDERVMKMMVYLLRYNTEYLYRKIQHERSNQHYSTKLHDNVCDQFGRCRYGNNTFYTRFNEYPFNFFFVLFACHNCRNKKRGDLFEKIHKKYKFEFFHDITHGERLDHNKVMLLTTILSWPYGCRYLVDNFEEFWKLFLKFSLHFMFQPKQSIQYRNVDIEIIRITYIQCILIPLIYREDIYNLLAAKMGKKLKLLCHLPEVRQKILDKKFIHFCWECPLLIESLSMDRARAYEQFDPTVGAIMDKKAAATKSKGNTLYKGSMFQEAIEMYLAALRQCSVSNMKLKSILFGNISQCYLKLEEYVSGCFYGVVSILSNEKNWKSYLKVGNCLELLNVIHLPPLYANRVHSEAMELARQGRKGSDAFLAKAEAFFHKINKKMHQMDPVELWYEYGSKKWFPLGILSKVEAFFESGMPKLQMVNSLKREQESPPTYPHIGYRELNVMDDFEFP